MENKVLCEIKAEDVKLLNQLSTSYIEKIKKLYGYILSFDNEIKPVLNIDIPKTEV